MKTLRSKLTVVFAFFAVVALAFGIGFMPKQASAAVKTSTGFYIEDGASIRTKEGESGIKWTAHITETAYNELNAKSAITAIGIAIQPQGNTNEDLDIHYVYGSENFKVTFNKDGEFVYSYAIYYDDLIKDIHSALTGDKITEITDELKAQYADELLKAYQTILEARPFVQHADGKYTDGEYFDTARSLQGVAVGTLVAGTYAEGSAEDTLLKSYLPNGYKLADTEYVADSYYSNYDAWGNIAIDSAIPMENATPADEKSRATTRVYYRGNDVTDAYNPATGLLELTAEDKVSTSITTDGSANEYLVIYDEVNGMAYKQSFVGVTLAIDHYEDFAYFTQKTNLDCSTNDSTSLMVADGDMEYSGYYVLLQDVDCEGYIHDHTQGSNYDIYGETWGDTYIMSLLNNKGLTGTFDGRGYTIKNFTNGSTGSQGLGLFGYINGGTLKNTGFYNPNNDEARTSGILAYGFINGAIIADCYFYLGEDFTSIYGGNWFAEKVNGDTTFRNVFINSPISHGYSTTTSYPFFGASANVDNCYLISSHAPEIDGKARKSATLTTEDGTVSTANSVKVLRDAEYVDGVERTYADRFYRATRTDIAYPLSTYEIVFDNVTYARGSTYAVDQIKGLKRYTTIDKMQDPEEIAKNDFSAWNPDVWTIVDGVPTFKSINDNEYIYLADDMPISENGAFVEAGKSLDVTVELNGAETGIKPQLEVIPVEGVEDVVSVSGNKVTGLAKGEQNVKIIYGSGEYTFKVCVTNAPIVIDGQFKFSAHDGQFYDDSYNVLTIADVVGQQISIESAEDGEGNALTVKNNVILGLDPGKSTSSWVDCSITVYTKENSYVIYLNAADAIIDEVSDLAVLTPQATGTVSSTEITYNGNDFVDDGYYILVKDIDGRNIYDHNFDTVANFNMGTPTMETIKESGLGFSGVFDGQGYNISNLYIHAFTTIGGSPASLFGWINGGIVKNLSLTNIYGHYNGSKVDLVTAYPKHRCVDGVYDKTIPHNGSVSTSLFATYLVDATIEDVYIKFGRPAGSNARLLYLDADSDSTLTRVNIDYTSYTDMNANGGGLFKGSSATLTDVYFVSLTDLSVSGQAASGSYVEEIATGTTTSTRWHYPLIVSATKDGVSATYDETTDKYTVNYVFSNKNVNTSYSMDKYNIYRDSTKVTDPFVVTVKDIKQYTTIEGFKTYVKDNTDSFSTWTNWTVEEDGTLSLNKPN